MDTRNLKLTRPSAHVVNLKEIIDLYDSNKIKLPEYQRNPSAWGDDGFEGFMIGLVDRTYFGMIVLTSIT